MSKKWFNVKRSKGAKDASIRIYDQIGDSWFGDSVSAKAFTTEVDGLGDDLETLNVYINSPGGNVYDGLAIYNYLKRHPANVVVHVDGIAASIASIIAMAGDRVLMPSNANMFVHNPWTFAGGDAASLRKTADELDAMRASLLGIYMSRVNIDEDDVIAMMDAETLLTAEEAVAWGFADEMLEESKLAASMSPVTTIEQARMGAEHETQMNTMRARLEGALNLAAAMELRAEELGEELTEAKARVEFLEDRISEMYEPDPALDAEDVIALVAEAKCPEWLATYCITEQFGEYDVRARVEEYEAIRDACVAAGVADPDRICRENIGNPASLISALLVETLAEAEEETKNRTKVIDDPQVRIDYSQVYAARRPKSH